MSEKITYSFPTSWADVDWGQYKALDNPDIPEGTPFYLWLMSVLTGKSIDFLRKLDNVTQFLEDANAAMEMYISGLVVDNYPFSRVFTYDGNTYEMPDELGGKSIGQWVDAETTATTVNPTKDEDGNEIPAPNEKYYSMYERLVQIYLQPLVTENKEYDYSKATEMNIDGLRAVDVMHWGAFFFVNITVLRSGTMKIPRKADGQTKRSKPVTRKLGNGLGFFTRWLGFKKFTGKPSKRLPKSQLWKSTI